METININMTPNSHEVETIHASQNDTSLRKWGIRPYDYEGNDVTNQQDKATLVDIKGQTLKWNQLIASNETVNLNRDSARTYNISTNNTRSVVGHKYYFATTITSDNTSGGLNCRFGSDFNAGKGVGRHSTIFTANDTNNASIYCYIQSNEESGTAISFKDSVFFDLTLMFGQGNEPTTVDEFISLFPLSYYPYDSGSLIPFMGNGLKTVGKNQFNKESAVHGHFVNGNDISAANTDLAHSDYISVLPNTVYCSNVPRIAGVNKIAFYDIGKNLISFSDNALTQWTTPSNCFFVRINMREEDVDSVCFNIGTDTTYESYTESVINLPISTYFPNGMKQAEDVYDELTESKASARVGSCSISDFGSTSSGTSYGGLHYADFTPSSAPKLNSINIDTNKDIAIKGVEAGWASTTPCIIANVSFIRIYGTTTDIQTEFSGMEIYFELATPIETDISPELDLTFNIDKGGTEELLPSSLMNGSVDLGSLTWTLYGANNHEFTAELPNMKVGTTNASIPSLGVNAVANYAQWTAQRPNNSLYKDTNGKLHLRLNPYETVAELTSALQGVYLWYEKSDSTPTTTPLNATIKYPAETKDVYFTYQESDFLSTIFKFYLVTKGIQIPCELEDDTLVADCTSEISNEPGFFDCKIKAENDLGQIFSNKFQLHIERSPE